MMGKKGKLVCEPEERMRVICASQVCSIDQQHPIFLEFFLEMQNLRFYSRLTESQVVAF